MLSVMHIRTHIFVYLQEVCYPYWPASVNAERQFGKICVKSIGEKTSADIAEHTLVVTDTSQSVSTTTYTSTLCSLSLTLPLPTECVFPHCDPSPGAWLGPMW